MSAKKRVFDAELGMELVLDEEVDQAEKGEQSERLRSKRAKTETKQPISNQKSANNQQQQQAQSRVSTLPNQAASRTGQNNWAGQDEDSSSEDYGDIDYGDDDDDEEFNSDNHKTSQKSEGSKSTQNTRQDTYDEDDDDDDDDHENIEHDRSGDEDEEGEEGQEGDDLEDSGSGEQNRQEGNGEKEHAEKCKYWPSCTAGEECSFYHPTKPCRAFPNCRFGQKCLYIHPPCKFGTNCARPSCPFAHPIAASAKRPKGPGHFKTQVQQETAPRCKYGFNCMNLMCKFSHQRSEPCRFGANCLLESCAYTHPSDVARKKPASAFKWSAQS